MSLPTRREVRNHLFLIVGVALVTMIATQWPKRTTVKVVEERTLSPEEEVTIARSKILGEFEAR